MDRFGQGIICAILDDIVSSASSRVLSSFQRHRRTDRMHNAEKQPLHNHRLM